jgi:hypothetical protein
MGVGIVSWTLTYNSDLAVAIALQGKSLAGKLRDSPKRTPDGLVYTCRLESGRPSCRKTQIEEETEPTTSETRFSCVISVESGAVPLAESYFFFPVDSVLMGFFTT